MDDLKREYAEKQRVANDARQRLEISMRRFLASDHSDYAILAQHAGIFKESVIADRDLEDAAVELHLAALEASKMPAEHPLWEWAQRRRRN